MDEPQDKAAAARSNADGQSAEASARMNVLQDMLTAAEARVTEATQRQRQAEEALAALQSELQQARDACDDALRKQALAHADLEVLRERFVTSEDARTAQESLLRRLTLQLRHVAAQLDVLHKDDQSGLEDEARQGRSQASAGRWRRS